MAKALHCVTWTAWGTDPPYRHDYRRYLTSAQHRRFMDAGSHKSESEAYEYVLRVGKLKQD